MSDHSDLIAELRALADCDSRAGEPLGKCMRRAADKIERLAEHVDYIEAQWLAKDAALSSQSLSLSEAREEIERLKGLVAGIRECPQEPVDVSAWRKAMEGVTPGDWSANGRFISAIGGVDTCEGAVYATIITCDHTYQSDGEGRHWSTTGSAERNAAWIVKCSPPAVAKLLDAYEAARSRAAEWAGSFGSKCGDHQAALRRTEDEREACAQLVENQMPASQDMTSTFICEALERAAAAIRARSVLENSKAPLADATNDPADPSSLRKGAEL